MSKTTAKTLLSALAALVMLASYGQTFQPENKNIDFRGNQIFRKPIIVGDSGVHSSAIAEFKSTSKGLLLPRVTSAQMAAITSPATGLMVYNTSVGAIHTYNGSAWVMTGASAQVKSTPNTVAYFGDDSLVSSSPKFTFDADNAVLYFGNYLAEEGNKTGVFLSDTSNDGIIIGYNLSVRDTNLASFLDVNPNHGNVFIGDFDGTYNGTHIKVSDPEYEIEFRADSVIKFQTVNRDDIMVLHPTDRKASFYLDSLTLWINNTQGAGKVLASTSDGRAFWHLSTMTQLDSVTIYSLTPSNGTQVYCTDCTGSGVTGRVLAYIGSAWRRFNID